MSHLSHSFSGLDVPSEGWSNLFKMTRKLFPPLWERSQICFEGKDDGPPDCLASPFTVILLGSLNLTGNPPWIRLLAGDAEPRPNLQRRLYSQWLPQSIPHNRAMFCKFREVCLHFGQKYTWSKSCTVCYNIRWVQISQQGYDNRNRHSEMSAHPSNMKFSYLETLGFI